MSWKRICRIYSITAIANHKPLISPLEPIKFTTRISSHQSTSFSSSPYFNYNWKNTNSVRKCYFSTEIDPPLIDPPLGETVVEVPLAQTGEGIAECELLKWFVKQGDQVEEFQPLCEVQSDKATIEITSRYKGRVADILYGSGEIVKVGETLLKMVVDGTQCSTLPSDTVSLTTDSCDTNIQSSLFFEQTERNNLATPAVRNMAKQFGINICDVSGSSKDGRVSKEDVLNYAVSKGICQQPSAALAEQLLIEEDKSLHNLNRDGWNFEDRTIPLRGFQRAMMKSMTMAAKVPHFHYLEEIKCDALVKLKSVFQNNNSDPDVKHTYLPFLVKSLSMALSKHPLLNSSFSEESNEIILKGNHNIGVAMATPNGLVVPNVKKVQSLSILEITKELARLQQLAFANKLTSEDISGGTITLSNIGAVGGKFGSPLLNLPEVAIIAIGRIQKVPRFDDDGDVYPASIANVNIGADHRVVDGASVARFCNDWKLLIEKPDLLLLQTR